MELLLLALVASFYLVTGYTAAVLGFASALFYRARPRLGRSVYWSLVALEYGVMGMLFGYLHWMSYATGWAVGRAYRPWYVDGAEYTGARSSRWFRRLRFWRVLHWWTDFKKDELVCREHTLFAIHPHGFLPVSAALGFALVGRSGPIVKYLPKVLGPDWPNERQVSAPDPLIAVTEIVFWIPFLRELFIWAGCVVANREVMIAVLAKRSLVVVPGGLREGTVHNHEKLRFSFCHRGFLKIAAQIKKPVRAMFAQGENRVWVVLPGWEGLRRFASRYALYPFPTLFIPFLFPHELRLRNSGASVVGLEFDGFASQIRDLAERYEHPDDIDLRSDGSEETRAK